MILYANAKLFVICFFLVCVYLCESVCLLQDEKEEIKLEINVLKKVILHYYFIIFSIYLEYDAIGYITIR